MVDVYTKLATRGLFPHTLVDKIEPHICFISFIA